MLAIEGLPVSPSKVRAYIEAIYPNGVPNYIQATDSGAVFGVIPLTERLNPAILAEAFTPEDEILWYRSIAAIHQKLREWHSGDRDSLYAPSGGEQPLFSIWRLLGKCREEAIPKAVIRLTFIQDLALRESIGRDIDTLEKMMQIGEWKAATVLGGSIIEALLLDALLKRQPQASAIATGLNVKKPTDPLQWDLSEMIKVSVSLSIITDRESQPSNVVREYRNLIHPGKERRTSSPCDSGTAKIAWGSVDLVVRKLS